MAYDIRQSGGWLQMPGKHPRRSTSNVVAVVADAGRHPRHSTWQSGGRWGKCPRHATSSDVAERRAVAGAGGSVLDTQR